MKGQLNMVVVVIAIFAFLAVFLLLYSFVPRDSGLDSYHQFLSQNLLAAVIQTETGIPDPECSSVADLLACSVVSPEYVCTATQQTCQDQSAKEIQSILSQYDYLKKYDILVYTGSEGVVQKSSFGTSVGNKDLLGAKKEKFASSQTFTRFTTLGEPITVTINLLLAEK